MPSLPCKHPTCNAFVKRGEGRYCANHQDRAQEERQQHDRTAADRHYDKHHRDTEAKAFYNSAAWQRARETCLAHHPICKRCQRKWAKHVHHKIPLARCTPEQRTAQDNLDPLCPPCHTAVEREAAAAA